MAYDFPNAPTLGQAYAGWVYDGEKWVSQGVTQNAVRYDLPQGLTANQMAQGRSNISVLKKNYIINGAMMVSQENGTTAGSITGYYPVDQFFLNWGTTTGVLSCGQVSSVTPAYSPNRIRVTVTTADAAMTTSKFVAFTHRIEGLRIADLLRQGTTSAKTYTIQFGVKAPAGTYCVGLRNATPGTRSYAAEYVITPADVITGDVVKSVVIPGDITGGWAVDTTLGLDINFMLMAGPTWQTPAGVWTAGNFLASPNQFNLLSTINNVFELFDVSLTEGNVAPPFQVPDYASELAACMRYWELITIQIRAYISVAGWVSQYSHSIVPKRIVPTNTQVAAGTITNATLTVGGISTSSVSPRIVATAAGDTSAINTTYSVSARL